MSKKIKIEPKIILTLGIEFNRISVVVRSIEGDILKLVGIPISVSRKKSDEQELKSLLISKINEIIDECLVDTIIIEKNKLLVDRFNLFPDFYILNDILLRYSVQITLEDNYFNRVKYFFEIPQKDWLNVIFNKNTTYSIDVFKQFVVNCGMYNDELLAIIDSNNSYKTLCFSESVNFSNLLNKKYLINEGV